MLEERARILSVQADDVWVEANRQQGCAKCEAGEGCGGGVLGKLVRRGSSRVLVHNALAGLAPGEEVVIGLDEAALLKSSLMAYLVPLLCMFAAALLAESLLDMNDLATAAMGLVGLMAGFVLFRYFSDYAASHWGYRPVVLRRAGDRAATGCQVYVPNPELKD